MHLKKYAFSVSVLLLCGLQTSWTENEAAAIERIFSACKKKTPEFDVCMKRAFNKLRPYFKVGIPEMGVAPFDPHFAREVKQTRTISGMGFTLTLRDVYEKGWITSTVTKYKTDWDNERIIYSQYFPEKWLNGDYEFKGDAFGLGVIRTGRWNLTLRDYSQTTRIKRSGAGVDVHVEVDHIGDMEIHVGNLLRGNGILERMLDRVINATWKPGFAVIRPLINDLVSTAFTDIWSHSFKNFPLDQFIKD
ncbi:circadian clock-controlled protein [Ostrinia furnacalis]|uniref:circadian clock-controlled protein n=1 Tax=Ostrinia furnacalis TaxID=93504 RepID=UPI0010403643|nr:circadian clock-controlled protein [Ostrinia furnacalis]